MAAKDPLQSFLITLPSFRGVEKSRLRDTGLGDGWGSATVLDGTRAAAASLNGLHDGHGGSVAWDDLAEDDVTAIEPAGDDGGDEELGSVAVQTESVD